MGPPAEHFREKIFKKMNKLFKNSWNN